MSQVTKSVPCPCCGKELCSTQETETGKFTTPYGASIQEDSSNGYFMQCSHCKRNIVVVPHFAGMKSAESFSVAESQHCT